MFTNCQLGNTYNPTKNYSISGWWSSPKFDGVRGLYIPNQGLMSRTMKQKYVGLSHIEDLCNQITGYEVIDGELYIPGEKFDKISGIVRDKKNYDVADKQRVQFHVFALWSENTYWSNTEAMVNEIGNIIPVNQSAIVRVPYTFIENTPIAVQAQNQLNKDSGTSLEGTVLRHPDVAYYQGRSQHLLKVKNFDQGQFTVTGFEKGTGKYSKSLGKMLIKGTVNEISITSAVGTGFTDAERQQIWQNQANYNNVDCELIHMGPTSNGSLRHPVFSRFL